MKREEVVRMAWRLRFLAVMQVIILLGLTYLIVAINSAACHNVTALATPDILTMDTTVAPVGGSHSVCTTLTIATPEFPTIFDTDIKMTNGITRACTMVDGYGGFKEPKSGTHVPFAPNIFKEARGVGMHLTCEGVRAWKLNKTDQTTVLAATVKIGTAECEPGFGRICKVSALFMWVCFWVGSQAFLCIVWPLSEFFGPDDCPVTTKADWVPGHFSDKDGKVRVRGMLRALEPDNYHYIPKLDDKVRCALIIY